MMKPAMVRETRETLHEELDAALVRALQVDGRASILELAELVGVSRDLVSQRLHALIGGQGLRVVAALDPLFAGHRLLTHVKVEVVGPVRPIADAIAAHPAAVFVSMVSGEFPLVFESRHGDQEGLDELLAIVRSFQHVRRVHLTRYADVLKGFFVADHRDEITLDELDRRLIAALQVDGRLSYRALSDLVHLSPSSVRARVRRMTEAGAIRIAALKSGSLTHNRIAIGVGITAVGDLEPIKRHIMATPEIDFAARSHGMYDFVATVQSQYSSSLIDALETMRALPEIGEVESWAHLNIVKEDYARAMGRSQTVTSDHWQPAI